MKKKFLRNKKIFNLLNLKDNKIDVRKFYKKLFKN